MKLTWDGEEQSLLEFVATMADECQRGRFDTARVLQEISGSQPGPGWIGAVPAGFVGNWGRLSQDVKLAIFIMAFNS